MIKYTKMNFKNIPYLIFSSAINSSRIQLHMLFKSKTDGRVIWTRKKLILTQNATKHCRPKNGNYNNQSISSMTRKGFSIRSVKL